MEQETIKEFNSSVQIALKEFRDREKKLKEYKDRRDSVFYMEKIKTIDSCGIETEEFVKKVVQGKEKEFIHIEISEFFFLEKMAIHTGLRKLNSLCPLGNGKITFQWETDKDGHLTLSHDLSTEV